MASRSLGELLLRPSLFARCQTATIRQTPTSWTFQRSISNTPNQPAAQPQRKETPSESQPRQSTPRSSPQRQPSSQAETSQAIDSLFSGMPSSKGPASRQSNSSDEMRAARSNHVFGSEFSSGTSARRSRAPPKLNFDDMNLPSSFVDPNLSNKPSDANSLAKQQADTFANYPRLNPTYGRTVELDPSRGRDLVRGIGMMASLMARNRIKHEVMKQRFHERNGLKRKRLNSERWRARFKVGFRDITSRVSELTRKGW